MSYYDFFSLGGGAALAATVLILGLLLKATGPGGVFAGYLVAGGILAFLFIGIAGLVRMLQPRT